MPPDCYAWIDPFAEIARAENAAAAAYDRGSRDAMRLVSGRAGEQFSLKLEYAVDTAAQKVAREIVQPHMAADYLEYEKRQRLERLTLRGLVDVAKPVVQGIQSQVQTDLRIDRRFDRPDMNVTVSFKTVQPFQYNVEFSLEPFL